MFNHQFKESLTRTTSMKKLLTALMLLASFSVMAAPQMGKDFDRTAQAINTDTPNKIEVVELFWYGCGHCHSMEVPLNAWVKKTTR